MAETNVLGNRVGMIWWMRLVLLLFLSFELLSYFKYSEIINLLSTRNQVVAGLYFITFIFVLPTMLSGWLAFICTLLIIKGVVSWISLGEITGEFLQEFLLLFITITSIFSAPKIIRYLTYNYRIVERTFNKTIKTLLLFLVVLLLALGLHSRLILDVPVYGGDLILGFLLAVFIRGNVVIKLSILFYFMALNSRGMFLSCVLSQGFVLLFSLRINLIKKIFSGAILILIVFSTVKFGLIKSTDVLFSDLSIELILEKITSGRYSEFLLFYDNFDNYIFGEVLGGDILYGKSEKELHWTHFYFFNIAYKLGIPFLILLAAYYSKLFISKLHTIKSKAYLFGLMAYSCLDMSIMLFFPWPLMFVWLSNE